MDIGVCRDVIQRLQGLQPPALYVGSLALNRPPAQYVFDDLHLLIHEDSLQRFRQAMETGPRKFRLVQWEPATHGASPAPPALIQKCLHDHPLPLTPDLGCSDRIDAPCTLWAQFYTNWRHGPLLLIDLKDWFSVPPAEVIPVPVLGDPPVNLTRPPLWALLLWQAAQVTNYAADRADPTVMRGELDKLHDIAARLGAAEWGQVVAQAQAYDGQYLERLDRIRPKIEAYARACKVPPARLIAASLSAADIAAADLDYGPLYDLRHALEALEAYRRGTVPGNVTSAVVKGTGARPRKLWHYPAPPGKRELGIAAAGFGIQNQIDAAHSALTWDELKNRGLIVAGIQDVPVQGYWADLTPAEFRQIFA